MDKEILAAVGILIALVGYSYLTRGAESSQSYSIPQGAKGAAGLDYIRNNYASQLPQAQSLCVGQFRGTWTDSSNSIGCFNMQGFSTAYCSMDIIRNLASLCSSIGGNPICTSSQASCSV
jgi:hypothetical protein